MVRYLGYPAARCAGCGHSPHDGSPVCAVVTDPESIGISCNCRACSRCGHVHVATIACTWKITDTSNCGCYGPRDTPAPEPRCPICEHTHGFNTQCPQSSRGEATGRCPCTRPRPRETDLAAPQPGPRYPNNGLTEATARGILDMIDRHATKGTRLLPLPSYEGAEVPWPVVRLVVDLALRGDRLGDVPRLTYCGVPVPWGLVPDWDQLEVNWWRQGVQDARDYHGEDFDA